jgi:NAD(P)-dependent dehydrogenase (short-subunit alcohol dehydrogenase family)
MHSRRYSCSSHSASTGAANAFVRDVAMNCDPQGIRGNAMPPGLIKKPPIHKGNATQVCRSTKAMVR